RGAHPVPVGRGHGTVRRRAHLVRSRDPVAVRLRHPVPHRIIRRAGIQSGSLGGLRFVLLIRRASVPGALLISMALALAACGGGAGASGAASPTGGAGEAPAPSSGLTLP